MKPLQKLGQVLALREHRSLLAQQRVQACVHAVRAAEQQLVRQQDELQSRQHALFRSERSAAALLKPGGSGARFEDFMAHARLVHERIRAQRAEVDEARRGVESAREHLKLARQDHAVARKAEEKTRKVQGNALGLLRVHLAQLEADQLEEAGELQRGLLGRQSSLEPVS